MSTTLNHLALSRAQLAQASLHQDAGSPALAQTHLQFAADHAVRALERTGAAPAKRDTVDFDTVQELIDSTVGRPADPAPATIPLYGGPRGAINARGAEAAERYMKRIVAAFWR